MRWDGPALDGRHWRCRRRVAEMLPQRRRPGWSPLRRRSEAGRSSRGCSPNNRSIHFKGALFMWGWIPWAHSRCQSSTLEWACACPSGRGDELTKRCAQALLGTLKPGIPHPLVESSDGKSLEPGVTGPAAASRRLAKDGVGTTTPARLNVVGTGGGSGSAGPMQVGKRRAMATRLGWAGARCTRWRNSARGPGEAGLLQCPLL